MFLKTRHATKPGLLSLHTMNLFPFLKQGMHVTFSSLVRHSVHLQMEKIAPHLRDARTQDCACVLQDLVRIVDRRGVVVVLLLFIFLSFFCFVLYILPSGDSVGNVQFTGTVSCLAYCRRLVCLTLRIS